MLKQEIMSVHAALGGVLGKVDPDGAELVLQCRRNLVAAAEQADALESNLPVVSVDLSAGEAEIALPRPELRITAREIKLECVFPARAIREVL